MTKRLLAKTSPQPPSPNPPKATQPTSGSSGSGPKLPTKGKKSGGTGTKKQKPADTPPEG